MSWGASLMRLPEGMTIAEMAEQFGNDWKVPPVGTSAEIHAGLRSLFPASDHRDGATMTMDAKYSERLAREQTAAIEGRLEAAADAARAHEESELRA